MSYLASLKEQDIFSKVLFENPKSYTTRVTVKGIVKNKYDQFAFITSSRHNCFLLAGGGADSADLETELIRECAEEIGYEISIKHIIGKIQEFRNKQARRYETICFLAEAEQKIDVDLRTESEKRNNLSVAWFDCDEVQKIMDDQYEKVKSGNFSLYNIAFNIVRDRIFFKEFLRTYTQTPSSN